MGNLKFYRPMQAVWESLMFGTAEFTTNPSYYSNSTSFRYSEDSGLDGYLYTDESLTTLETSKKFIGIVGASHSSSGNSYTDILKLLSIHPFFFNYWSQWDNTTLIIPNGLHGTTNGTHDSTRNNINNKVADIVISQSVRHNGQLDLTILLTNNGEETVTVKAIERVLKGYFYPAKNNNSNGGYDYFLAWAYYLDESEWITLSAGETKTATFSITLSDLTL